MHGFALRPSPVCRTCFVREPYSLSMRVRTMVRTQKNAKELVLASRRVFKLDS